MHKREWCQTEESSFRVGSGYMPDFALPWTVPPSVVAVFLRLSISVQTDRTVKLLSVHFDLSSESRE